MTNPIYASFGVQTVINASGKMTNLGGSVLSARVADAMREASQSHVELDELYVRAGELVAEATGAEAAWPTTGAAAGIALSVAAVIAGTNPYHVSLLPDASFTSTREVILQAGHLVNFGAPISQMIRLGGGVPLVAGAVNGTSAAQVRAMVGPATAALLFVRSHHCVQKGVVSLGDFAEIAHANGLPLIVDAAAEEDLRSYVARGGDLVTYSGGKAIGGPTSGFVAGRRELIDAVRAQGRGIGRPMKVGKEQVIGFLAALREYTTVGPDLAARNRRSEQLLELLQGIAGLTVGLQRDEAGRDITRVALLPTAESGLTAMTLAARLAGGTPSIRSRNHQANVGVIFLDPREMSAGAEAAIAARIREIFAALPAR